MKFKKYTVNEYEIVEEGLCSSPFLGEGRLIPALVLNPKKGASGLKDLLEMHDKQKPGDVLVEWGHSISNLVNKKTIFLNLTFVKPKEFTFQIVFNLKEEYSIVDGIFQSRSVFIDVGEKGEKVSGKFMSGNNNFIVVEVVNTDADKWWDKVLRDTIQKILKKDRIPKMYIKEGVDKHIKYMRDVFNLRRKIHTNEKK